MKNKVFLSALSLFAIGLLVFLGALLSSFNNLPPIQTLETCFEGKMNQVKVCPKNSSYVQLANVSKVFVEALIVSEDASFWHHEGVDWFELKESFKANLKAGSYRRGGSTISQQLIKNAFLSQEKSVTRKLKEFLLTRDLEEVYSKEFILEKYLNIIELGQDLYGLKEASRYYFYKSPDQLGLLESAYLVHLLPSPKKYSRTFESGKLTEFSKKMILLICKRLLFYKKISQAEFDHAAANVDRFPWYGVPSDPIEWNGPGDYEANEELTDEELDQTFDD